MNNLYKRIDKVGVEIEGAFRLSRIQKNNFPHVKTDLSVKFPAENECEDCYENSEGYYVCDTCGNNEDSCICDSTEAQYRWINPCPDCGRGNISLYDQLILGTCKLGEVNSLPLSPDKVEEYIIAHYPDYHNKTCGLHCHISIRKMADMALLYDSEFPNYIRRRMEKFGEAWNIKNPFFWSRLAGENGFCTINPRYYTPREKSSDTRYRQVNYIAFKSHKTIEFRMLPVFENPRLSYRAIDRLISLTNRYIIANSSIKSGKKVFSLTV